MSACSPAPTLCCWAERRAVLTRDFADFAALHDLVLAAGGDRTGIFVVHFDNDRMHNLTERGIASALGNLEASGIRVADAIHVLNHWR